MKLAAALLVIFQFSFSFAKVQLLVWSPSPYHPQMILPQVDNENPLAAVIRYHESIKNQPELMRLFPEGGFSVPVGKVRPFSANSSRPATWLVANDPEDMGAHPQRVQRFIQMFQSQKTEPYVLPLAADLRLNEKDRAEYFSFLARSATLALGMGGSDLDPALFGQENRFSVDTNLARDSAEARLWRGLLRSPQRPYIVAICRSHQFILSLLGFQLVQDIESELHFSSHRKGKHLLEILNPSGFENLYSSLPPEGSNTFHHQGFIEIGPNQFVKITARAKDGIIEATVFTDGSGATFQFHPELMSPEVFWAFVQDSLEQARIYKVKQRRWTPSFHREESSRSCKALF